MTKFYIDVMFTIVSPSTDYLRLSHPAGIYYVITKAPLAYYDLIICSYTPKAVVIDNHLPRQPLISSYVPDWPLPPRVYIPSESEMALRARIYAYNRHLSFDVAFICSTLTHCGVCHLSVWRLKWEVSYVHQSVWRWKWFFCQSNYVLQRLRFCRKSDTVFRREIDSRRQWGYGTCYGGIVSPPRRSVICSQKSITVAHNAVMEPCVIHYYCELI